MHAELVSCLALVAFYSLMSVRVHPQKERCNYACSYSRGCSMGGDESKHPLQGHRSFVLRCLPRNPPSLSGHSPGAMPARASRLSLSWTWRKLTNLGKLVTRKRRPDGNYNTACTCPSEACRLAAAIVSRICTCICVDRQKSISRVGRPCKAAHCGLPGISANDGRSLSMAGTCVMPVQPTSSGDGSAS